MGDNMFHTGPSPARFAGGLSHFVGEAVWPLRGRGTWPMTWRLRGARLWAGMARGARRMQKSLLPPPAASYHYHYASNNYH